MAKTSLEQLSEFGQSIWLDNISRSMIEGGRIGRMIDAGLRGMTSNPSIFDKSISQSSDYDQIIKELGRQGKSVFDIYDEVTVKDVQDACDIFKPVYEKTGGLDGYVSLEVNPKLAFDTSGTIKEARRLWGKVGRKNLMLKVPATDDGFLAVEELVAEGMNVNITLIFSVDQYVKTAQAYLRGIKRLSESGKDISSVHSVASVFVSRVDTIVDNLLDGYCAKATDTETKEKLRFLQGRAAVANSNLIYQKYSEIFSSREFLELKNRGANIQRVLWGSTSTKNPSYSDIKYVSELIAKNTVNTVPENTIEAFLDHGAAKEALTSGAVDARQLISRLAQLDINVDQVCAQLLKDGLVAFEKSFDSLLASIKQKAVLS